MTAEITQDIMEQRTLMRIGAISAVVGAIIFMIANILHPRSPNIQVSAAQIETVANSDIWLTDHLALLLGAFLMLMGLVAIQRSITKEPGAAWARLGYVIALVSTAHVSVLTGLDGITSKVVHDAWAAAPDAEKVIALRVAEAVEEIDIGLFSIYIIIFFGVTFILYGLGIALSDVYPKWLGWVAVILGAASFVVGTAQAYTGLSVLVTNTLFASLASFLTIWLLVMGIILWRKTTAKADPQAGST